MHQPHIIQIFDNQQQYFSDLGARIYEFNQWAPLFVEIEV